MDPITVNAPEDTLLGQSPDAPPTDLEAGSIIVGPDDGAAVPLQQPEQPQPQRQDVMGALGSSWSLGWEQVDQAYRAGARSVDDRIDDEQEIKLLQQEQTGDADYMAKIRLSEDVKGETGFIGQAILDAAQSAPSMLTMLGHGIAGGAPGALAGAAAGAAAGNLTGIGLALPEEVLTVPGGALFGGQWGFRIGAGEAAFRLSYGQVYQDARLRGVPRHTARLTSLAAGGIMTALEFSELKIFGEAGRRAAADMMRNPVIQRTLQNQILKTAKDMGIDVIKEAGIEGAQQLTQQMSEVAAGLIEKGHQWDKFTSLVGTEQQPGVVDDTLNAFVQAIGPSAVLLGLSHGAGTGAGAVAKVATTSLGDKLNITNFKQLTDTLGKAAQALRDMPETTEQEAQMGLHHGPDGKLLITTGIKEQQMLDATAGPTDAQVAQAEGGAPNVQQIVSDMVQTAEQSGVLPEGVTAQDVLQSIEQAIPPDRQAQIQEGLDAIYPQQQTPAQPDLSNAREVPTNPSQIDTAPKSPLEVQARLQQINNDIKVIDREMKQQGRQLQKSVQKGAATTAMNSQIQKLNDARETLQFEKRLLEQGLIGPEDIQKQTGQVRIQKISALIRETQRTAESRFAQGERKGSMSTRQAIKNYQRQITTLVKQSGVDPKTKAALLTKLANVQTEKQFNAVMPEVINRIEQAKQNMAEKTLTAKIESQLERAKLKKGGKAPKGKFTAEIQDRLDTYKAFIRNPEARQAAIEKVLNDRIAEKNDPNYESPLTEADYQAFDIVSQLDGYENFSPAELEKVSASLGQLIDEGKSVAAEKAAARKARREAIANKALESIAQGPEPAQGRPSLSERLGQALNKEIGINKSWENFLHLISEYDPSSTLEKLLDTYKSKVSQAGGMNAITTVFSEKLQNILDQHPLEPNLTTRILDDSGGGGVGLLDFKYKNQKGEMETRRYTKADLMGWYAQFYSAEVNNKARNALESTGFTFRDQVGEESAQAILEKGLTEADKAIVKAGVELLDDYHARINDFYRERNGVSLPKEERYFPMQREGYNQVGKDILEEGLRQRSIIPGSAIKRTDNKFALKPQDFYQTILRHFAQWEHAMAYADLIDDANAVFGNGQIRTVLEKRYGDGAMKIARYYLDNFINGSPYSQNLSPLSIDALRRNITFAKLALKPIQTIRQLSSMHLYWTDLSPAETVKGLVKTIATLPKTAKAIYENPIMANRWKNQTQDIKDLVNSNQLAVLKKSRQFSDYAMIWTNFGDNLNSIFGGGALYNAVLDKTGDPEEAIKAVVQKTESTQQSGSIDQITPFQGGGPLNRIMSIFKSQQNQLFQLEERATRDFIRDVQKRGAKADWGTFLWKMSSYRLSQALYTAINIGAGMLFLPPSADPEELWEKAQHELARATLVGNLNGMFILGDVFEQASFAANALLFNEKPIGAAEVPWGQALDNFYSFGKALVDLNLNNNVSIADVLNPGAANKETPEEKVIKAGAKVGSSLGLPTENMYNIVTGVQKSMENDDPFGAALAILGLPPSTVKARNPEQKSIYQLLNQKNQKVSLFEGASALADDIIRQYSQQNDKPEEEVDQGLEDALKADQDASAEEERQRTEDEQQAEQDAILKQQQEEDGQNADLSEILIPPGD